MSKKRDLSEAKERIDQARSSASLELDLTNFPDLFDLTEVSDLRHLEKLVLNDCPQISDLRPLTALTNLRVLELRGCESVSNIGPLSSLTRLESIDLMLCNHVVDLKPLEALRALRSLSFLGCIFVTDLSPLSALPLLEVVDLFGCQLVSDLGPLFSAPRLKKVRLWIGPGGQNDIFATQMGVVRPAPVFAPIPQELTDHPYLEKLISNKFADVPPEIESMNHYENCLFRLRAWMRDKEGGSVRESEEKVFLLGNGSVGKTQLCRFLTGAPFDDSIPTTHGVKLATVSPSTLPTKAKPRLNIWDFGGQDIYHGTHALFLRCQAVFIILWAEEQGSNASVAETSDPTTKNRPLAYWLDYVRYLATVGCPVLVVQSKCDTPDVERFPNEKVRELPNVRVLSFSAKSGRGGDTLIGSLRDALEDLARVHPPPWLGRGWAIARNELLHRVDEGNARTLDFDEFQKLCTSIGDISEPSHLLSYLHRTGVVFFDPNLFEGKIILDQSWALDAIYAVFDREKTVPFLRGDGTFTSKQLDRLVWGAIRKVDDKEPFSDDEQKLFISMMESCGICFQWRHRWSGETVWIAPDLLPSRSAVRDSLVGRLHEEEPPSRRIRLRYRFWHEGIIRTVLSVIGGRVHQAAVYWRTGVWLYEKNTDSYAVLEVSEEERDAHSEGGLIEIKLHGDRPDFLAGILLSILGQIYPPPTELSDTKGSAPIILASGGNPFMGAQLSSPMDAVERQAVMKRDTQALQQILEGRAKSIVGEANQIFREVTQYDCGIDGEIEFKNDSGRASGKKIYVQLKNGASYLRRRKSDGMEIFDVKERRLLEYWKEQITDVYLIISDGEEQIRWMNISRYLKTRTDADSLQVVFTGETFDEESVLRVRAGFFD